MKQTNQSKETTIKSVKRDEKRGICRAAAATHHTRNSIHIYLPILFTISHFCVCFLCYRSLSFTCTTFFSPGRSDRSSIVSGSRDACIIFLMNYRIRFNIQNNLIILIRRWFVRFIFFRSRRHEELHV